MVHLPEQLHALAVGEFTVEYHLVGDGPTVVLLHGGCCGSDDWDNVVGRLSKRFQLFLPDGLVHPLDPWAVWRAADHLGIDRVALVGHSAGGTLARRLYQLAPQRVRGLVDIDGGGIGRLQLARKMPNDLFSPQAAAMYEQRRAEMEKLRPHHRGDYPSSATIDRRMLAYQRQGMTPQQRADTRPRPQHVGAIDYGSPPTPIEDTGALITCPALEIQTGRGKIQPGDVTDEYLHENMQAIDLQYELIVEAGHWPWLEDGDTFIAILEPFLARTV